jgi:hypothetical protein
VQAVEESLRREAASALRGAAGDVRIPDDETAVAVALTPGAFAIAAPTRALQSLDSKALVRGEPLGQEPFMIWWLGGEAFRGENPRLTEGLYTLAADESQRTAELRDGSGAVVGRGPLVVCVEPPLPGAPGTIAKQTISGGIDKVEAHAWPPSIKVCGHVSVKKNGVTVTVKGCVSAEL